MPRRARRKAATPVPHPRSKARSDRLVCGRGRKFCRLAKAKSIPDSSIVHGRSRVYGNCQRRSQKNSRAKVLTMNRRDFLQSGGIASVSLAFAKLTDEIGR